MIRGHYHSQNSYHEENSSRLRTDNHFWVQYLEDMQVGEARMMLDSGRGALSVKKRHITGKLSGDINRVKK